MPGPSKVNQWLADNGDPRTGAIDMVDWIELIPYGETRNYVQRVLENVVIYRRPPRRDHAGRAMEPVIHRLSAWDGLPLCVLQWNTPCRQPADGRLPLLCLPGLVRTAGDFARFAGTTVRDRRVVAIDYPGRGRSGRSADPARYRAEACLRDVMDACAALHLHRVAAIGTSFGGLLAMGLAAARPGLIGAAVLNDVGPEIGDHGAAFVRRFVGHDPALPDLESCVAWLQSVLPPLSLDTDEDWRAMASLTYAPGQDGRYHPVWDIRIARAAGHHAGPLGAVRCPRSCAAAAGAR